MIDNEIMKSEGEYEVILKKVNIKSLKEFAREKLPHSSLLKSVLITEKEHLTISEFLAKMEIWLKLLDKEIEVN